MSARQDRYRRIKRRREVQKRIFLAAATAVLVLAFSLSWHAVVSRAESRDLRPAFKYYTSVAIESGDTLWSLAEQHVDGVHYTTRSSYIEEVCRINNIEQASVIQAGDILVMPYYSDLYVR